MPAFLASFAQPGQQWPGFSFGVTVPFPPPYTGDTSRRSDPHSEQMERPERGCSDGPSCVELMFLTGWPQAERHEGIPSKSTAVHREVAVVDIFRDELGRLAPFVGSRRLPYGFWRPLIIGKSEDRLNDNWMYLAAQAPLAWRGKRRANCIPHRRLPLASVSLGARRLDGEHGAIHSGNKWRRRAFLSYDRRTARLEVAQCGANWVPMCWRFTHQRLSQAMHMPASNGRFFAFAEA